MSSNVEAQAFGRERAWKLAEQVAFSDFPGHSISEVLTVDEITFRKPCLYGVKLTGAWIAYLEPPEMMGLVSSTIVVIDSTTGELRYAGSAMDEG